MYFVRDFIFSIDSVHYNLNVTTYKLIHGTTYFLKTVFFFVEQTLAQVFTRTDHNLGRFAQTVPRIDRLF